MQLDLNRQEWEVLRKALDTYAREYDRMLVRTDNPTLQHAMQSESNVLNAVRRRIDALGNQPGLDTYV